MALLEVQGLAKTYGRRRVVDGVDFAVEPGQIVGLLGPNGAGKTTTVRMLLGLSGKLQADAADALAIALTHAHTRSTIARLGIPRTAWRRR